MALNERELLDLKDKIERAKASVAESKGQLTMLMQQLKDDYECASTEQLLKKTEKISTEMEEVQEKINTKSEALEAKL